jgi:hypothetical protein
VIERVLCFVDDNPDTLDSVAVVGYQEKKKRKVLFDNGHRYLSDPEKLDKLNNLYIGSMSDYDYSIRLPWYMEFLENDFNTWQTEFVSTNQRKPTVNDLQVKLGEEGVSIFINHCNFYYLFPTINMFGSIF